MNTSVSYYNTQKKCSEFLGKLQLTDNVLKLIEYSGSIYFILPLMLTAFQDYIRTQRLIRQIRKILNSCKMNCEHTDCLHIFYKSAKDIRDNYLNIYKRLEQTKLQSFFLKRITEKSLNDWDELAVDCRVGSDGEFRGLILQIAENS